MTETWRYDVVDRRDTFPWPPREGEPVLGALGETWKSATFEPSRLFRGIPREGGTAPAILYYLIIGILVAGASLFWETVGDAMGIGQDVVIAHGPQISPMIKFFFTPILLLIGLVLSAGVTHLILLLLRGATHGFDTTLRVFCYAYSPLLFGIVPVLGTIVGTVWMLIVAVLGLAAAHSTDRWRPALAIALPFVALVVMVVMAIMAVLATGAAILG
jgi:hypothetical protein